MWAVCVLEVYQEMKVRSESEEVAQDCLAPNQKKKVWRCGGIQPKEAPWACLVNGTLTVFFPLVSAFFLYKL
jgi:hypothetical protein